MRGTSRITYLWPGLDRLWHEGDIAALATAIAFAVVLNFVLLASFVRWGNIPVSWRLIGWGGVAAFWGISAWRAVRQRATGEFPHAQHQQDLFIQAQDQYLKGHWVEAQGLLEQLIRRDPGDVASHLLLSSVYRRSRRLELSRRQLERVQRLKDADAWRWEIQRELALLDRGGSTGT
jgi:hypothetical protein